MTRNKQAIANWKTQYYFDVNSVRGSPTGAAWYDSGTTTVNSTVTTPSGGYETVSWTGTGSLSSGGTDGSDDTGVFTILEYSSCTWNWENSVPTFGVVTSNSTVAAAAVMFNVTITDNVDVSHYIYSWNNTGPWTNSSTYAWTSNPATFEGTWNETIGNVVNVKVYANDTSGNWGESETYNFIMSQYSYSITWEQDPLTLVAGQYVSLNFTIYRNSVAFEDFILNVTKNSVLFKQNLTFINSTFTDSSVAGIYTYDISDFYDSNLAIFASLSGTTSKIVIWQPAPSSPGGFPPSAATYAISIRVVRGTAAVPAVTVTLAEQSRTTDTQGYATFSASAGTHNLNVVQEGTIVYTTQFQVDASGTWQIDLDQPDQPPTNITPEEGPQFPEIPPSIAQLGIVVIVVVLLIAFFTYQSGPKKPPNKDWKTGNGKVFRKKWQIEDKKETGRKKWKQ